MPKRKLTDLFVERAKPPAHGRVEYFDALFPGLALRVTTMAARLVHVLPLQRAAAPLHDRRVSGH